MNAPRYKLPVPSRTEQQGILAAFRRKGEWIELTKADLLHRLDIKRPEDANKAGATLHLLATRGLVSAKSLHGLSVWHVTDAGKRVPV
jgi:hypothetical protein